MQISAPRSLLTPARFDINAKTLYARHREKGVRCEYYKCLYLEHLRVWNGFFEAEPRKLGPQDFMTAFDQLLDAVKQQGYAPNAPPVPTLNGSPYNGAHRVAASIVHGVSPRISTEVSSGRADCGWKFFRDKRDIVPEGLAQPWLDAMALEHCRTKRNLHTVSLFAADRADMAFADACLARFSRVVYEKTVQLTERGRFNYMLSLYEREPWVGSAADGWAGLNFKTRACFGDSGALKLVLVESDNLADLVECKRQIREHYGRANHSIHINDTQAETWVIASSIFHEPSLHFLNHAQQQRCPRFTALLAQYRAWLQAHALDVEDFCVVSSAVLAAYGLRDCQDLDFLAHAAPASLPALAPGLGNHAKELPHYGVDGDEIIYNPAHHFYLGGLKFCTLNVVKVMKARRREPKDLQDLGLILSLEGQQQ